MQTEDLRAVLTPLGFTETEALVYVELLRHPEQTGYSLAKAINKGQPVTYAALSGLENKGAVISSGSPAKDYRAVPPSELLRGLRHSFESRCREAEERLAQYRPQPGGDRLFRLRSKDQVFERGRTMLAAAEQTVLFELFPGPAGELRDALAAAGGRPGVSVAGVVLDESDRIPGTRSIVPALAGRIKAIWNMESLTLIVDARQVLLAGFRNGGLDQAFWTDSLYLAVLIHNAICADVMLHETMEGDWPGANLHLFGKRPPGFFDLVGGDPDRALSD